jgi:hypothetical protein
MPYANRQGKTLQPILRAQRGFARLSGCLRGFGGLFQVLGIDSDPNPGAVLLEQSKAVL